MSKEQFIVTQNNRIAHVLSNSQISQDTKLLIEKAIEKAYMLDDKIPCNHCQGQGCTVCNGYGYYFL